MRQRGGCHGPGPFVSCLVPLEQGSAGKYSEKGGGKGGGRGEARGGGRGRGSTRTALIRAKMHRRLAGIDAFRQVNTTSRRPDLAAVVGLLTSGTSHAQRRGALDYSVRRRSQSWPRLQRVAISTETWLVVGADGDEIGGRFEYSFSKGSQFKRLSRMKAGRLIDGETVFTWHPSAACPPAGLPSRGGPGRGCNRRTPRCKTLGQGVTLEALSGSRRGSACVPHATFRGGGRRLSGLFSFVFTRTGLRPISTFIQIGATWNL